MAKKGFEYLIEYCNSNPPEIDMGRFTKELRYGATAQQQLFPNVVEAYMKLILRTDAGKSGADHARSVTMDNISVLCVLADHDWESEIIPQAQKGGPQSFEEYIDNVKLYGPAVRLLSNYLGIEGYTLRRFICDEQYRN